MKIAKPTFLFLAAACWILPSVVAREPSENLKLARQLNEAFVEVAERVSPAVVVINVTEKSGKSRPREEDGKPLEGIPPEFREFSRGQGSGVLVREDGYIITNGHVVEDADSIEVRLHDGRTFKAKLRGTDPQSDLAVIKIDAKGLPVATWADSSKTRVGEFAIAIGAPFSLDYSVTFGHVSAKGRDRIIPFYLSSGPMMDQDFIQTDANINPGNSGGPLINIDGEVIGINTLIRGLHTGIGFAIPSTLAKQVSDQLIAEGKFTRSWLGITIRALQEEPKLQELYKITEGVVVFSIVEEGPAAGSELKRMDVITAVDGKPVKTPQQLRAEVRTKKIGEAVTLDVFRSQSEGPGNTIQVKVKPGEWKEPVVIAGDSGVGFSDLDPLGLSVHPFTPELARQYGLKMNKGVIVTAVEKGKPAARQGMKPGDVITALDRTPITTVGQFHDLLKKADLKKGVLLNLLSGNTPRSETLKEKAD